MTGIGRDRIAELIVSGPGIATTQAYVFSRPEQEIRSVDKGMMRREPFIVHAPNFQLALAPGIRVQGTIRDNDSGRPIAGLEIQAAVFDEHSRIPDPGIEAIDRRRRKISPRRAFQSGGLPTVHQDRQGASLSRTRRSRCPAESPGLEPITFDIAMKRGVFVRGKVIDKVTGQPIKGTANYYAFADNPHVRDYAGFSNSRDPYAPIRRAGPV